MELVVKDHRLKCIEILTMPANIDLLGTLSLNI